MQKPLRNPDSKAHLLIDIERKEVSEVARRGAPDCRVRSGKEAHCQLEQDDEADLEVEEVVVRACTR